jgi:hypothetical protein
MMRTLRRGWNRVLGSLFGRRTERDLAEEIAAHIQLLAEENIRRGVPAEEAYRRARLQFGSVESTKESYRDQRGLPVLDSAAQDLRHAFRGIRKNPGFAAVAILSWPLASAPTPPSFPWSMLCSSGRLPLEIRSVCSGCGN